MDDLDAKARDRENEHAQLVLDYRFVLGTPAGRRMLWHLLGLIRPAGSLTDTNGLVMAAKAARRDCADEIERVLAGVSLTDLQLMEQENIR